MSKKGLHRHYDKLGPEERFRLDVLAMARGDGRESERLVRSCPRATYTTNDRAFTVRWTSCENIALRISLPFMQELGRLRLVDAMRVLAPYQGTLNENLAFDAYHKGHEAGSYHAWHHAGKTGHPPPRGPRARTRKRYGCPTRTSGTRRWSATKRNSRPSWR